MWKQNNFGFLSVNSNSNANRTIFRKHLQLLRNQYKGKMLLLNLLGDWGSEPKLSKEFERVFEELKSDFQDTFSYQQIDFHKLTGQTNFEKIYDKIASLMPKEDGFYHRKESEVLQSQRNFIWSNCLDCLDRTNVVQSKCSFLVLFKWMEVMGKDLFPKISSDLERLHFLNESSLWEVWDFRAIWADHADVISEIYTGTGSTSSQMTWLGNKANFVDILDHGGKSLSRFYINLISDDEKQVVIEQIVLKSEVLTKSSQGPIRVCFKEGESEQGDGFIIKLSDCPGSFSISSELSLFFGQGVCLLKNEELESFRNVLFAQFLHPDFVFGVLLIEKIQSTERPYALNLGCPPNQLLDFYLVFSKSKSLGGL